MVAISLIYAIAWWIQNETRDLVSLSWIKNKKSFLYNILPIALKAEILRLRISGWIWCSCYILVVIYSSTFICTFQGRNHFLSRVLFFWLKGVVNYKVYFSIFCSFANFSNGFFENYFFFSIDFCFLNSSVTLGAIMAGSHVHLRITTNM